MNVPECQEQPVEKYLTFMIAQERFGLPLSHVRNIQAWKMIKAVSGTTGDVIGKLTSLQERNIPVIDLGKRLGLHAANCDRHTLIIEAMPEPNAKHAIIGLAIDTARPFQDVNLQGITERSDYQGKINKAFVHAVGMCGKDAITILRLSQIVNPGGNSDAERVQ